MLFFLEDVDECKVQDMISRYYFCIFIYYHASLKYSNLFNNLWIRNYFQKKMFNDVEYLIVHVK